MTNHTLLLGSGQAVHLGVGNKAAFLDRAAQAGLPVPQGIILLDSAWREAVANGLVVVEKNTVVVPDAVQLTNFLQLNVLFTPPPTKKALHYASRLSSTLRVYSLAVRSAFSAEDRQDESLAGYFTSRLFVEPTNPAQLAAALAEVWGSALRRPGEFRRDVLLMEMVQAQHAGVAFTERDFEDDLVNYTPGTADVLVSGEVEGEQLLLPKLRRWERGGNWRLVSSNWRLVIGSRGGKNLQLPITSYQLPINYQSPFALRLQRLLHDVRRTFGLGDWDIEWADDGIRCWLVQIRPITRPSRRNEAFTIANHKEILPELPSRFMSSLIASCADSLFAYYRRFDASLPAHRPFIELFYGRPYINLSLLSEMMRIFGLPTRLVTDNIGGETGQVCGANPGRLVSKIPVLLRLGLAQLRAVTSARQTMQVIVARTATQAPGATFGECVETLRWLYTTLVTEMFSLTAAMSGPLSLLRRLGVLEEHHARQKTIATAMFADLEPLRQIAARKPKVRAALTQGKLPNDRTFCRIWQTYLDKHGHRGVYESDIARPRLYEAPAALLTSLAHPASHRPMLPPRTLLGWLTLPLWWQASRAMRAREQIRYHAMLGFDRIRQQLLLLAKTEVVCGILPDCDSLWRLYIDEVQRLDQGWIPDAEFWAERKRDIEHLQSYHLPDLFYRFDDLERYHEGAGEVSQEKRLTGISLTSGEVRGRAWVLAEPSTTLPPGFTAETTILVARSVDAGWIPTFACVAGVVVETGGDLSHGSIILREIGLPAITNVRRVTRIVQTGDELLLQAGAGRVERISIRGSLMHGLT